MTVNAIRKRFGLPRIRKLARHDLPEWDQLMNLCFFGERRWEKPLASQRLRFSSMEDPYFYRNFRLPTNLELKSIWSEAQAISDQAEKRIPWKETPNCPHWI
jgi:hypothetical protein